MLRYIKGYMAQYGRTIQLVWLERERSTRKNVIDKAELVATLGKQYIDRKVNS